MTLVSQVHGPIREVRYNNVEEPCRCMHIIQILYDKRVVNSVEGLAEINACSKNSMRLPEVKSGVDKVQEFDEVVSYGKTFQATLAWVKKRFYERKEPSTNKRFIHFAKKGSFSQVT